MKKIILGILTAMLAAVPVFAHPPITVFVDDTVLSFDQPPIIQDDRTLVPMRSIFEAMGATVVWDEPAQMISAFRGEDTIVFLVGHEALYKNGEMVYTMAVPAQIVNDRLLVPLRAIAESLGTGVSWDGIQYEIRINSDGSSTTVLPPGQEAQTDIAIQLPIPTEPIQQPTEEQSDIGQKETPSVPLSALISDSEEELEQLWLAGFGALIAQGADAFYAKAEKKLEQNLDQVQYYLTESGIGFYLEAGIIAPEEAGRIAFEVPYALSYQGIR